MLPDKTRKSILNKAIRMGLKKEKTTAEKPAKRTSSKVVENVDFNPPDPHDGLVLSLMSLGLTPSEIDRKMGWFRGSARLIVTNIWERQD